MGLPKDVYTRIWREAPGKFMMEAVNLGKTDAVWSVSMANGSSLQISKDREAVSSLKLSVGETAYFTLSFDPALDVLSGYLK